MKKKIENYKLFNQGDKVYCLFDVSKSRSIYIPLKIEIIAIEYKNPENPKYTIKIIDFYDKVSFMKIYFLFEPIIRIKNNLYLNTDLDKLSRITKKSEILAIFACENNYTVMDSINCFESKQEMMGVLDEIMDFVVRDEIIELLDLMTRNSYSGLYKLSNKKNFLEHNKDFLKKDTSDFEWDNFLVKIRRHYNSKHYRKNYF